jgi:Calcium binding
MVLLDGRTKFPFKAHTNILKRDGSSERTLVDVIQFAADLDRFGGDALYVHVDYQGLMIPVEVRDLEPVDASKRTLYALKVWAYGKSSDFDLSSMLYYLGQK